ncbi:2-phospho-L-lactate transferase [Aquabacter spiritensis]|uniref:LPPG:FO 2-phospho-L-lactate transferase n=1 Tax=Aquabacter spiritensis TaxID=933073 RepID=A0A4R3LWN0_9HYPH|nr:2-phospho-L-lactate transferase [Aquabacter spiritensis]TCT05002.1 LPPG:FO 2-phospho-L-lactate transferase [Aquabacter spiritensis]
MIQAGYRGGTVIALCGGIGGAKLALGLARVVPAEKLTVIVNTGDDFRHFGLAVCPDIDTVVYTLAGRANPQTGWGRAGESWRFMEAVGELGGETWFALGDTDLATCAVRTARLADGARLTTVTADIARALGVGCAVLPASDDAVRTVVETADGDLAFQTYFVGCRCAPAIRGLRFDGAATARVSPEVAAAFAAPDLEAIVLCPSNPYLSIDPILAIPGLRALIAARRAPLVAVSPIVGGTALKGPLAKLMAELGLAVTPATVLAHYGDLVDVFVLDTADADQAGDAPRLRVAPSVMVTLDDRIALARSVLAFARGGRP